MEKPAVALLVCPWSEHVTVAVPPRRPWYAGGVDAAILEQYDASVDAADQYERFDRPYEAGESGGLSDVHTSAAFSPHAYHNSFIFPAHPGFILVSSSADDRPWCRAPGHQAVTGVPEPPRHPARGARCADGTDHGFVPSPGSVSTAADRG